MCNPPDWDSDVEKADVPNGQSKQPPPAHAHVPVGIPEVETQEQVLLQAAWNIKSTSCQKSFYKNFVHNTRSHIKGNVPHSEHPHTLIVDYGQNLKMSCF